MDEEIDRLVVAVRADTSGLQKDVADIRSTLDGSLARGADVAGRGIESALLRAVRTGKLGFEDLQKVALQVLTQIADAAIPGGINALFGTTGGLGGLFSGLFGGAPGRATGGPVSPGQSYLVGERGPELFVPTSSGRIAANQSGAAGGRDVRVAITINAPGADQPRVLAQSSRQVARAVRAALNER